jgi:hypothetical protein
LSAISASSSAHAACTTPAADAGSAFYNTTQNAIQFCDGTSWYNTGLVVSGATGTACTNPVGPEGSAYYNTTQNTVQFCNGDDWVNMGTMKFPAASGTACTVPTGPEGTMFFNTTVSKMQFCNGDDWVNATYLTITGDVYSGVEIQKIQSTDVQADDRFGRAVAIYGDYAIVGALEEDTGGSLAGSAYIFKNTAGTWAQEAKIQSTDIQASDYFGASVDMFGDYVVVGATNESSGASGAGAAYIFKRTGTSWAQEAKIQAGDIQTSYAYAETVSINGDYVIVGSRNLTSGGAAYTYKRTGTSWAQEAKIVSSDLEAGDNFGNSVSLSGDYAIVGAYQEDINAIGSAYIFKRTGTSWAEEAKIQASDKDEYDQFARSVAIDGDYVAVGAFVQGNGALTSGAAYIFKRSGTSWNQEAQIFPSDRVTGMSFGKSVDINGDTIIVGADSESTGGASVGAAYIYKRSGTSWSEVVKIQASDKQAGDKFGYSVSIDNGKAISGSYQEDTGGAEAGAAYIFD